MSLKGDKKYFVVLGNEYGINHQDMDNMDLVDRYEADAMFESYKEEQDCFVMFMIEDNKIKVVKEYNSFQG